MLLSLKLPSFLPGLCLIHLLCSMFLNGSGECAQEMPMLAGITCKTGGAVAQYANTGAEDVQQPECSHTCQLA